MSDHPIPRTIDASEARSNWSKLLNQVFRRESQIIVEKGGTPVAAIISVEDLARFNRLEAEREARFTVIDQIREAFSDVPDEELEREIPKAVAEARAQLRAEREQIAGHA